MKLANIIYEKELVNHIKVDYINYYKESIEYDKLDKRLPTLYVGWSFMKASNPNNNIIQNADILKKKIITNELYWECSFEESKSSHVNGIENFINLVPQFYFFSKYEYIIVDPIFSQIKNIQDLLNKIPEKADILYNFKNEMIYLLSENKIFGVDINIYKFFQFNIDEIKDKLLQRTNASIIDLDGDKYIEYYKILPNFTHLKRFLVTLLTK